MNSVSVEDLKNFALLAELDDAQRQRFCDKLKVQEFATATVVFQEGDKGGSVYFLLKGEVEITQALTLSISPAAAYDNREKSIVRLSGEHCPVFGEVSVFGRGEARSATVKTLSECHMGILDAKDFLRILEQDPAIGYKVMRNLTRILSERLTIANQNILKLTTALSLILEK